MMRRIQIQSRSPRGSSKERAKTARHCEPPSPPRKRLAQATCVSYFWEFSAFFAFNRHKVPFSRKKTQKKAKKQDFSFKIINVNDIVNEIKTIPNNLKAKIASIRIDTGKNICDKSLKKIPNNYGVSLNLVKLARQTLDANGMKHVKIIVSSGFNLEKIKKFIKAKAPVDFYGVGGSIVKINTNITCDLVCLNGKPQAKFGRKLAIQTKDLKKLNIYI